MVGQDAVHRWVILASSIAAFAIDIGVFFSFGVLYPDILATFRESRASSASIQSVLFGFAIGFGAVSGCLITRLGCRSAGILGAILSAFGFLISFFAKSTLYLVLSIGVLAGAGQSIVMVTSTTIVGQYFDGELRLATMSAVIASVGIGGIAFPYVVENALEGFTLSSKLLLVGGGLLNVIPLTFLWHPTTSVTSWNEAKDLRELIPYILRNRVFLVFVTGTSIILPTMNSFITLFMDIFMERSITEEQSVTLLLVFNIGNMLFRLVPGLVKYWFTINTLVMPLVFTLMGAIGFLSLNYVTGMAVAVVVAAIMGCSYGGLVTCLSAVPVDIVGMAAYPVAVGIVFTLEGIVTTALAPMSGYLRDGTGSYADTLFISIALLLVGCILFTVDIFLHRKASYNRLNEDGGSSVSGQENNVKQHTSNECK